MRLSRAQFNAVLIVAFLIKCWLAARLPLFGDEAFYWLESSSLALAYTDVPALTPWLIALGTTLFGDTVWGVRAPFLLIGGLLPLQVAAWSRRFVAADCARAVGAASLAIPLAGTLGVLALPDVPLTAVILALALVLARIFEQRRTADFIWLGVLVAVGWLAHYRFIVTAVPAFAVLLLTLRGRRHVRDPRWLMVLAIGSLGVLPTLIFNATHDWQGFAFQYVERHPWRFSAAGFAEPLVQLLVVTPLLAIALMVGLRNSWGRRLETAAPWDVLAAAAGGLLAAFLVLGLVADAERTRFHWMLPGWLLLLPALPSVLASWSRNKSAVSRLAARFAIPIGVIGSLALVGLLIHATRPPPGIDAPASRPLIDNISEWPVVADLARQQHARNPDAVLIAGDFMLGAQLEFALRQPVAVLPHPRNAKHGRAGQLALLGRDMAGLERRGWDKGLLLIEDSARREIERLPALLGLCERFGRVDWREELVLRGGRFRVLAFAVDRRTGRSAAESGHCDLPPLGDFDAASPRVLSLSMPAVLEGWAIDEFVGSDGVEIRLGDVLLARVRPDRAFPGVLGQWPMSTDPNHPNVGFSAKVDLAAAAIAPGTHRLRLFALEANGRSRLVAIREISVVP
jgi:hypothetical protein